MNAIPVLTIEDVATLDGVLGDFLKKTESDLTVVIDRGGNVISQCGDMDAMDVTVIAALAAGSFAATRELARRIGEVEFNALYHQGIVLEQMILKASMVISGADCQKQAGIHEVAEAALPVKNRARGGAGDRLSFRRPKQ